MSNMMIYAALSATGGNIENVYGTKMRVRVIDASDKDEVEQAKADGWMPKADDVIEQIETEKLEAENKVMKGKLDGGLDGAMNKRIDELEEQLSTALTEIAGFEQERTDAIKVIDEKIARIAELEQKLAIYEETKDVNGDGVVSYDEMEVKELHALLDQRGVKYVSRDTLKDLIKKAKDSE